MNWIDGIFGLGRLPKPENPNNNLLPRGVKLDNKTIRNAEDAFVFTTLQSIKSLDNLPRYWWRE